MLKLTNLQKNYRDFRLDCTMEVRPGMITGFIGANGAGKSTTVKAVLGLIRPDGGRIELFGRQLDAPTPADKRRMGVALAESGFSGELTVRDVEKILAAFYPAFDPAYYRAKAEALGLPAGKAILISSHISGDLEQLCDDFYMIDGGKIICHEDTDRLLSDYAILKVAELSDVPQYILRRRRESFGWSLLTDQKRFFAENYPGMVIERITLDEFIMMMLKGEAL